MILADFLVHLLKTQAETLQHLAAFFGEEELLEILEAAGEQEPTPSTQNFELKSEWFENPTFSDSSSAYAQLEGTVREMKLSAVLEFHLWAYPFYRVLIESSIDLKSKIKTKEIETIDVLTNEALTQAKEWVKNLPIRPGLSPQVENLAFNPWLRFRTELLKKAGKSPFTRVS